MLRLTSSPSRPPTSGGAQGRATYEWMEGGFFLIQHVDLQQYGQKIKGIEIIGHERPFGEEPGEEVKSRFYDNMGNTLSGAWHYPGGGGYEATSTRIE